MSAGDPYRKLAVEFRAAGPAARAMIRRAVQKTCADTKSDAQSLAPVDTGTLKSSISYETRSNKNSIVGEVGPTADYGLFVEVGTSRMGPQPYMRPAFDRRAPILEQILEQMRPGDLP